ncbi:MAG: response regulator [Proteobacteria bacterium]|nr:response regulator [Pseudomonadota bacterium]
MGAKVQTEKPTRILVVDDEPNELRALTIGLKLEGFHVVGVTNGNTAIDMLKKREFAVALTDLMMPQMNGIQLAREIRNISPSTKTVLMSAYTLSPSQLNKIDIGIVGFVTKPYEFEELVSFLKNCIDNAHVEAPKPRNEMNVDHNGLHLPVNLSMPG